jgi:MFS family permease
MPSQTTPGLTGLLQRRFRALRYRDFRLYWTCQIVSLVGTWMQTVAQGWLLHELDSSAMALGILSFLQFLPVLPFSLWAGVIADRIDKRKLLLVTQSAALLQAVVLAWVVTVGIVTPSMVYALALVFGVINAFDLPTRQSFLVEMVGKEDLSNAIALNSAAFNGARIVGPAVAGVLLAAMPSVIRGLGLLSLFHTPYVGEAGCFWINALSYAVMIVGLMRLRVVHRLPARLERALADLAGGIRYALSTGPIRNLLILLGFMASLGFQYLTLLPLYAKQILGTDANGYGALVSAFGIGSLISAAIMTRRLDRWDLRRNLLVGLLVSGVGLGVFAWSRSLALSLVMGFLAGFGLILYVASTNTMLQLTLDDRFRGRVMSLYTLMLVGTAPIGSLLTGGIAQRFGAPAATSFSAGVLLLGAVWVAYRLRVLAAREGEDTPVPLDDTVH